MKALICRGLIVCLCLVMLVGCGEKKAAIKPVNSSTPSPSISTKQDTSNVTNFTDESGNKFLFFEDKDKSSITINVIYPNDDVSNNLMHILSTMMSLDKFGDYSSVMFTGGWGDKEAKPIVLASFIKVDGKYQISESGLMWLDTRYEEIYNKYKNKQ